MINHTSFRHNRGFTLVELIVVMVISGIVSVMLVQFIVQPMRGFTDVARRAAMVDRAENALQRIRRDVRAALPNSVRLLTFNSTTSTSASATSAVCPNGGITVCSLEILNTIDGGRYRAAPPGNTLQFNNTDTSFAVIGTLQNAASVTATNWVVINNQTVSGPHFNAYNCPAGVGTSHNCVRLVTGSSSLTQITLASAYSTTVSPPTPPLGSVTQRFFIVDTPVTYRCNTTAGTLDRHQGYGVTAAQAANPAGAVRIADRVTACTFTYTPGTNSRSGLLSISLSVTDAATTETVRLLHQVQVDNAP